MRSWIRSKSAKAFAFASALYVLVVLLNFLWPASRDGFLAQRFNLLLYIAPALIVVATIFDTYRERARTPKSDRAKDTKPL